VVETNTSKAMKKEQLDRAMDIQKEIHKIDGALTI
jgi:hypothetical protein